jgi:arylsulfatase A-like enzyme
VPFVVRWPQHVAAGSTSDHLSGFQDVLPTLAAIAGIEVDAGELQLDGLSLLPTLRGEGSQAQHEVMYWEYAGQQAIRMGRWKGVRPRLRKGELALELYDLEADRAESKDVAAEYPEVVAELEALMEREHIPSEIFPLPTVDAE